MEVAAGLFAFLAAGSGVLAYAFIGSYASGRTEDVDARFVLLIGIVAACLALGFAGAAWACWRHPDD